MNLRRHWLTAGAALSVCGCVGLRPHAPAGADANSFDSVATSDVANGDWEVASPERHGLKPSVIDSIWRAGATTPGLRSLVIVRNGVLIGEQYYHGAKPNDLQRINSITKSITSILVGLAIARQTIAGLGEPVDRLLPDDAARFPNSPIVKLSLEQIMQGRTGFDYDLFGSSALANAPDPVAVALSLPQTQPTASGWTYNDPLVGLLSPILARAQRADIASTATQALFSPLGIGRYSWRRDQLGRTSSFNGLSLRTRDLAKFAWTMANDGRWRDRQVVPLNWVRQSTRGYGGVEWDSPSVKEMQYGYLWFSGLMEQTRVVWGWGYGGQLALFAPQLRLAIATAATSPPPRELYAQASAIMTLVAQVVAAAS